MSIVSNIYKQKITKCRPSSPKRSPRPRSISRRLILLKKMANMKQRTRKGGLWCLMMARCGSGRQKTRAFWGVRTPRSCLPKRKIWWGLIWGANGPIGTSTRSTSGPPSGSKNPKTSSPRTDLRKGQVDLSKKRSVLLEKQGNNLKSSSSRLNKTKKGCGAEPWLIVYWQARDPSYGYSSWDALSQRGNSSPSRTSTKGILITTMSHPSAETISRLSNF